MTQKKPSVRNVVSIPLPAGLTDFISFHNLSDPREHVALAFGNWKREATPLVRMHSECLTGDVFASLRCDCGKQLAEAQDRCRTENGLILYLRQEGRDIGLYNKLDAYQKQAEGADTYTANRLVDQPEDARSFKMAAEMLQALGIHQIRLLSNNPEKAKQLESFGIKVIERLSTGVYITPENQRYLQAKRDHKNHGLSLPPK